MPGDDCDDTNPNFAIVCPDCGKSNHPGCKCTAMASNCYTGDPTWIGKGICKPGVQLCNNGFWGECKGQTLPEAEVCDGLDNDCDGQKDEGVLSPCGTCDFSCVSEGVGPGWDYPFNPTPDNSRKLILTKEGWLVLGQGANGPDLDHIWIANSKENTVSKLDTITGKEDARYRTCGDPSRTAVDLEGNCWVGCRGSGRATFIINEKKDCIDKNGNGKIETSFDTNGDGKISTGEMLPYGKDECIKFDVKPTGMKYTRAVGVNEKNEGLIGDWVTRHLRWMSPKDGKVLDIVNLGCSPYGVAVDQKRDIWVAGRGCASILKVDPKTKKVTKYRPHSKFNPYGINVDIYGKIWTGNCCSHHAAYRFDPVTGKFSYVATKYRPRGIATSIDGYAYLANDIQNSVAIIDVKTMKNVGQISLGSGRFPIGMAVDYQGKAWAVNQQKGTATKIDPKTKKVIGEYKVGKGPYTYSDMTGYTLHHFTAPKGKYCNVFGLKNYSGPLGVPDPIPTWWREIKVYESTPKGGAHLKVQYRAGNTLSELTKAKFSAKLGPFPPATFPIDLTAGGKKVVGRYLEVCVDVFAGLDKISPIVKAIVVKGKKTKIFGP